MVLGIKEPKLGIKQKINSDYVDLSPDVNLNATSLDELDEETIVNTENIYVDPFKPLFLHSSPKKRKHKEDDTKDKDISIKKFMGNISNDYLNIIEDLLNNNYNGVDDLLLKGDRGLSVGILFIIIAIFFVFFTPL